MKTMNDLDDRCHDIESGESASGMSDVIVGNIYDKYHSRNPVARWLMNRFLRSVTELYQSVAPRSALEVGCGEGYLARHLTQSCPRPERFEACDISLQRLSEERDPLIVFREASIYQLPYDDNEFDVVVCCEVLEHLEQPLSGLSELARVSNKAVLLSTPREPLWRILNMLRGRYWSSLGNTPGHVQHFSRRGLIDFAKSHLQIVAERTPYPWTVLLGELKP